ncbi:helix-turn-helix domain-containing protein [Paraburkholderia aspalathi]|uniref:helix-turn-helix domain-containing protein n=1 Tax=Paraburkholderia aspalathi TaxID=1324617 RepID=UPI0038B73BBD
MSDIGCNSNILLRRRVQSGMSRKGLAERSGVSEMTIAQLERGAERPTLDMLTGLSHALGLPLASLMLEAADGQVILPNGGAIRLLDTRGEEPAIEVYLLELDARTRWDATPHVRGVRKRVTVLSGVLLAGARDCPQLLRAGDTHAFDADRPHVLNTTATSATVQLMIEYPVRDEQHSAATTWLSWPNTARAWDGVRAAVDRALIDVANGVTVRVIRFTGGTQSLNELRKSISADGIYRWPVVFIMDAQLDDCFIVIARQAATFAFASPPLPTRWLNAPDASRAMALARLAESCFADVPADVALADCAASSGWVLNGLAIEALLQRGTIAFPKRLTQFDAARSPCDANNDAPVNADAFSSRIDVHHYDAYEILHPGYARQVVALAQDIAELASAPTAESVLDVGSGPGIPLLMLRELHPTLRYVAIEPDPVAFACLEANLLGVGNIKAERTGFLEYDGVPEAASLITSVGASHHFNTAFMFQKAAQLLCPGGLFIVADEFLAEFETEEDRNRMLILHHAAYLMVSIGWIGEREFDSSNPDVALYGEFRRDIVLAWIDALEYQTARAMRRCRALYARVQDAALDGRPLHELGYFVRFYRLELQAMIAGFDYEVERKTWPQRFVELARFAGLEQVRHRRVFATIGTDESGAGTHVFSFRKRHG